MHNLMHAGASTTLFIKLLQYEIKTERQHKAVTKQKIMLIIIIIRGETKRFHWPIIQKNISVKVHVNTQNIWYIFGTIFHWEKTLTYVNYLLTVWEVDIYIELYN